eukprot:m51a1_g7072 putative adenylate guanylate cyclase with integral membrane sensor (1082) ;mRNA; r:204821-209136
MGPLALAQALGVLSSVGPRAIASARQAAAESLLHSISNASAQAFTALAVDAERTVTALVGIASRTQSTCIESHKGLLGMWRNMLDFGLVPPRTNWYICGGDRWGRLAGVFGAAQTPLYVRPDPVVWLMDPGPGGQWDEWLVSYYLHVNKTTSDWEIGDYTAQSTTNYDVRQRPWYTSAVGRPGTIQWGDVYLAIPERFLVLAVSRSWAPLGADVSSTDPCGVICAMVSLTEVDAFLQQNRAPSSDVWIVRASDEALVASTTGARVWSATDMVPITASEDLLTRNIGNEAHRMISFSRAMQNVLRNSTVAPLELFRTPSGTIRQKSRKLESRGLRDRARNCKCEVSVRFAVTVLVALCVLLSAGPEIGLWYSTATSSTQTAAENLMHSVSNVSVQAFTALAVDAERTVTALVDVASRTQSTCIESHKGLLGMWRNTLDVGLIPPRTNWYIGGGDRWGRHAGVYGAAPMTAYDRPDPVAWLMDPGGQWDGVFVGYYLRVNTTSSDWEIGDYTGQNSTTYDARTRPWYKSAVGKPGTIQWGDVYLIVPESFQIISVSKSWAPLGADVSRVSPCGAFTVMMSLTEASAYLRQNKAPASDVWLVSADDEAFLLASSTKAETGITVAPGDVQRIPIAQSEDDLTRDVGRAAGRLRRQGKTGTLQKVTVLGRKYHLLVEKADLRPGTGFPLIYVYVAVPVDVFFAGIERNIGTTIGITVGLCVVFALGSSVLSMVVISRPLASVVKQLEKAAALDSWRGITPNSRSTGASISEMSSIQDSMQKMWLLLGSFHRYVPLEVLRLLQKNGDIAQLSVSRRPEAIMFCDIENFTPLTEDTEDHAVLLQVFTEFMDICTKSIDEYGGLVDKFIGDCVMAFWGYPGQEDRIEFRACSAAIEIQRRLEDARPRWSKRGLPILKCRIGIASGLVLVGNSGSSNRLQYTVLGGSVNLASRLEPLNKAFGTRILVDAKTQAVVAGQVLTRKVCHCRVKGIKDAQQVYEVVCRLDEARPDVAQAVHLYNDAVAAMEQSDLSAALDLFEEYTTQCPGDLFAERQLQALRESKGGAEFQMCAAQERARLQNDDPFYVLRLD